MILYSSVTGKFVVICSFKMFNLIKHGAGIVVDICKVIKEHKSI